MKSSMPILRALLFQTLLLCSLCAVVAADQHHHHSLRGGNERSLLISKNYAGPSSSFQLTTGTQPPQALKEECDSGCTSDQDCQSDLVCSSRNAGCADGSINGIKFCVKPLPIYEMLGPNPDQLLGLCQGDCDADYHCQQGLVCHHRGRNDPIVGCDGTDSSPYDYCAPPVTETPTSSPTMSPTLAPTPAQPLVQVPQQGNFKLKLYWQQGYTWQEENFERRWCVVCEWGECLHNAKLWIDFCEDYLYEPQRFQFWPVSADEIQIQMVSTGYCMERVSNDIHMRTCDVSNPMQLWWSSQSDFSGERFELKQKGYESKCVSQEHHPKPDEEVEMHPCEKARQDDTSYWNIEY